MVPSGLPTEAKRLAGAFAQENTDARLLQYIGKDLFLQSIVLTMPL